VPSPPDAPNVLVIYTDDQPQEWVGAYGGEVLTPNIDRLAEAGLRFDRYYASSPVCSPSRYSALTGRYASRSRRLHRSYPPGGPVNIGWEPGVAGGDEDRTVARVLQEAGYTTGFVGKWHGGVEADIESIPADADGRDPDVERTMRENYGKLIEQIERCGFDEAHSAYAGNVFAWDIPEAMERHNMEWVTQGALEFLDAHGDERFFLQVAPTLTHDPWEREQIESDPRITPAGYLDEPPDVQPPREDVLERVTAAEQTDREPDDVEWPAFMTREEVMMGRRFATWLDDGVGAILDRLDDLGVADETLVVFTSDHGNRGKFTCYDAGARQPCIARWPGVTQPGTEDALVSNVDLAPTIFDVVGVEPDYAVDGRSFAPLLTGAGSYERESLFLEITTERAVVTDDGYKYIAVRHPPGSDAAEGEGRYSHWGVPFEDGSAHHTYGAEEDYPAYFDRDQLYDLDADPHEQGNLADDPAHADRLAAMRERLRAYSADLPHEFGEFT